MKRPTLCKQLLSSTLILSLLCGVQPVPAANGKSEGIQIRGGISVGSKGSEVISSLSLRDADIRDVLYSLAEQGGFNLIVADDVSGTISLDLKDVSINKMMEYIMTLSDLTYYKDGSTFIVTTLEGAESKNLNKIALKSVPVKYSNAQDLADVLNSTVFSINRPGGNTKAIATADQRTNSILIMGNDADLDLANRALAQLDFPLEHKTYFLKHARAQDVANTISQTLFSVSLSSSGGTSGGSSGGASGSSSSGASGGSSGGASGSSSGGASGSSSGGASGSSSGGGSGSNSPAFSTGISVFRGGPMTFIANAANNTLTLIGTAQQLELAEAMLYDADIQAPQVAIQLSFIQLSEDKTKSLRPSVNPLVSAAGTTLADTSLGGKDLGLNILGSVTTLFWGKDGQVAQNRNNSAQLVANLAQTKAKILANPTVMAISGTSSSINVTRDILGGTNTTADPTTGLVTTTPVIRQVGIQLTITPEVANDGSVTLNLTPSISSDAGDTSVDTGTGSNTVTLTTNSSLSIAKARVHDGETLILGGLIQDSSSSGVNKIPFLGDIPFLGNLFRTSTTNRNSRSELVILVTPHIIKEDGVAYFRKEWRDGLSYDDKEQNNTQYATSPNDKSIVPTANTGKNNPSQSIQTLENTIKKSTSYSGTSSLSRFDEVLK